jgi:hypothetical protein
MAKTYFVHVYCTNCMMTPSHLGIPYGVPVDQHPCPHCGCKALKPQVSVWSNLNPDPNPNSPFPYTTYDSLAPSAEQNNLRDPS